MEKIKVGLARGGCEFFPVGEVGTGHRAVQIGAGVPFPQDLSASSPSTPWHCLKKMRFKHKLVSVWGKEFGFKSLGFDFLLP